MECPKCGNSVIEDSKFCIKCGENIEPLHEQAENTDTVVENATTEISNSKKYLNKKLVMTYAIILLACIGLSVYGFSPKSPIKGVNGKLYTKVNKLIDYYIGDDYAIACRELAEEEFLDGAEPTTKAKDVSDEFDKLEVLCKTEADETFLNYSKKIVYEIASSNKLEIEVQVLCGIEYEDNEGVADIFATSFRQATTLDELIARLGFLIK